MKPVVITGIVLILLYVLCTYALFSVAFVRRRGNALPFCRENTEFLHELNAYRDVMQAGRQWYDAQEKTPVHIRSRDGLTLRGELLCHPQPRGVVLACHGYRSTGPRDFSGACRFYYEMGFSLLVISQRACGDSEGRYITLGVKERLDCLDWISFLEQETQGRLPIVLAGISMGATTVLLAAGQPLPEQVRAVIADCGFCSPWDELAGILHTNLHVPAWPLLNTVNGWCRRLAGFDLREASVPEAMKQAKTPILFLHGEADSYVPCRCSQQAQATCRAPSELLLVPGAGHGMAYLLEPERYRQTVRTFLSRCGV